MKSSSLELVASTETPSLETTEPHVLNAPTTIFDAAMEGVTHTGNPQRFGTLCGPKKPPP